LRGKPIIEQIESQREILKDKNEDLKNMANQLSDIKIEVEKSQNELKNLKARDEEKDMIEGQ